MNLTGKTFYQLKTAMEAFAIKNEDGSVSYAPAAQFVLNEKQQFLVIGIDFDATGYSPQSVPGVEVQCIGALSEQTIIFQNQVINSLNLVRWNFEKHPDPQVIMLTDNRPAATRLN